MFGNFPKNLHEIFATVRNYYEFHSQNFYNLRKNFINNYYAYKIYPTISTDQNWQNVYTYELRKIRVSAAEKNCIITLMREDAMTTLQEMGEQPLTPDSIVPILLKSAEGWDQVAAFAALSFRLEDLGVVSTHF